MAAAVLEADGRRLCRNAGGANLTSGVASALLAAGRDEVGLFEVDEAALPAVVDALRPARAGARQPVSRPARPLRRAGADRRPLALHGLRAGARCDGDPQRRRSAGGVDRRRGAGRDHVRPGRRRRRPHDDAARRRLASGARAAAPGWSTRRSTSATWAAGAAPPAGSSGRGPRCAPPPFGRRAGSHGVPAGAAPRGRRRPAADSPACTTSTTPWRRGRLRGPRRLPGRDRGRPGAVLRGLRPVRADRRCPAGRRCCCWSRTRPATNEVIRTLAADAPPKTLLLALNDRIADGRDVSWIWDVDFEELVEQVDSVVGDRHAGGRDGAAAEVRRRLPRPDRRGAPARPMPWTPWAARTTPPPTCWPPTPPCSTCAGCSSSAAGAAVLGGGAELQSATCTPST